MPEYRCLEAHRGDLSLAAPSFRFVLESNRVTEAKDVHADIASGFYSGTDRVRDAKNG